MQQRSIIRTRCVRLRPVRQIFRSSGSTVRRGDFVKFDFDFDLFLRWLLKIGYNVARARRGQWPVTSFGRFRSYIVGKETKRPAARVLLQLVPPAEVLPGTIKELPTATEAPPIFHRVAALDTKSLLGFSIGLYSYYFYVLIEESGTPPRLRSRTFKALLEEIPGAYQLRPGKRATIYSSSLDMFQIAERSSPLKRNVVNWSKWRQNA